MVNLLIDVACVVGILFLTTIGIGIFFGLIDTIKENLIPLFKKEKEEDEEE